MRAEAPGTEVACNPAARTCVTPGNPSVDVRRPRAAVGAIASTATGMELQSRCQWTQTGRCFVFHEAALVNLLVQHEHLLAQEREARSSRIPHEPALHCTRRHVREGERLPMKLPMARPLEKKPGSGITGEKHHGRK